MFVGWKLFKRTKFVRVDQMDLITDRYNLAHIEGEDADLAHGALGAEARGFEAETSEEKGGGFLARFKKEEKGLFGKVKRVGMWLFF